MKKGRVILICGLPGSGKTTLAKLLEDKSGIIRFSPDEWMEEMEISLWNSEVREALEQRFWLLAQKLALLGNTVVLENGFWSKQERDKYLKTARKLGFQIELRPLFVPIDETRKRLKERDMEGDNVLLKKIEDYYSMFEMPNADELALYDN